MMFDDFYLDIELMDGTAIAPQRAHLTDAGIDIFTPEDIVIPGNSDILVPTKIKMRFPKGYAVIFQEKSGRAAKDKLTLGAKVIDSDYRGEIFVNLFNNSPIEKRIKKGTGITQAVVFPVWSGNPNIVESIDDETVRGSGGFGSTDKNESS